MLKIIPFVLIFFLIAGSQSQKEIDYTPMFFSMGNEWENIKKDETVFSFLGNSADTTANIQISHKVRLLSNEAGQPLLFFSELETPVCADGECKLANIKVYWNLLGNYVGFGVYSNFPLTKFEHDNFQKEDYLKLHNLLLDNNSIIKRRTMSSLIDKVPVSQSDINSKDLDGISGATKKEIKESVVKGGLYSCYTIWHLVHGDVKNKIKAYLKSINSNTLNTYFLYSPYKDYQIHALKQLNETEFKEHIEQIISIFKTTNAITRSYILKKITRHILDKQDVTNQFYKAFSKVDINSQTLLIKNIKLANPIAVEILSSLLNKMTRNQLKLYLIYLENNPEYINKTVKSNLVKISKSKSYIYSYLIKEFLKKEE